ncbi:MAG: GAF domain-containing protein [Verrucomicrobia bacterium]|nr:GAF domain-containing protein [Verrucomicrobiota bacterium]
MRDRELSAWTTTMEEAVKVINEVVHIQCHHAYLRTSLGDEWLWHFERGLQARTEESPEGFHRAGIYHGELLASGERLVILEEEDGRQQCVLSVAPFPGKDIECHIIVGRASSSPFTATETRLLGYVSELAASKGSLHRLLTLFLDRWREVLGGSSVQILRKAVEDSLILTHPRVEPQVVANHIRTTGRKMTLRAVAKLITPNRTALWSAVAVSTKTTDWTKLRLAERYSLVAETSPSIAAEVFRTGEPIATDHYPEQKPKLVLFDDTQSHLSVPIAVPSQDECVGVLTVENTGRGGYDRHTALALTLLASRIALPLAAAQQREALARRKRSVIPPVCAVAPFLQ